MFAEKNKERDKMINFNPPVGIIFTEDNHQKAYQVYLQRPVGQRLSYEDFKKTAAESFAGEHYGDCTACPCTCFRCLMEEFYGIESTVTWSSVDIMLSRGEGVGK